MDRGWVHAARDEALYRPRGRLRVRFPATLLRVAAVGVLRTDQVPPCGAAHAFVARAGVDQRLQRGGRVVDIARARAPAEREAAVAVLLALDPARRATDRRIRGRVPDGLEREDREGREV